MKKEAPQPDSGRSPAGYTGAEPPCGYFFE